MLGIDPLAWGGREARRVNGQMSYKVTVCFERREDGGLRAWSEDLPELVLSHSDPAQVLADVEAAMRVILEHRLGGAVEIEPLESLSPRHVELIECADSREFAARAA